MGTQETMGAYFTIDDYLYIFIMNNTKAILKSL